MTDFIKVKVSKWDHELIKLNLAMFFRELNWVPVHTLMAWIIITEFNLKNRTLEIISQKFQKSVGMSRVRNGGLLKVVEFDKVTATSFTVYLNYSHMYIYMYFMYVFVLVKSNRQTKMTESFFPFDPFKKYSD